jgi:Ca2+/H+ antiporter, TMEM165/GDT1 family
MLDQPVTRRCVRGRCVFIPFIAAAAVLAFGAVVMLLWNAILPGLLGVATLTYWQAVGLLILSKILFSGWHGRHHDRWHRHAHFKNRLFASEWWTNLSEEERTRISEEWSKRCCH